jgi:hypothetical protein
VKKLKDIEKKMVSCIINSIERVLINIREVTFIFKDGSQIIREIDNNSFSTYSGRFAESFELKG